MKNHSRYNTARKLLIFWCLFIGLGALGGSVGMLTAPDGSNLGMQAILPYFQVLPFADALFQDFVFPGIALLCVNGVPNLVASALLLSRKRAGVVWGTVFGFTLMAWITIQFVIFPMNFMSTIYFIFGLAQALTGIAALIFLRQESFAADLSDYPNVGRDHTRLVVYMSRMGYTRRTAYEEANRTGADVYEVRSTERTEGTPGFWWCGRYGMHRWDMPIEAVGADISAYDHVTVCSPVWVFHLAAPMRSFCRAEKGNIRSVSYILTHFQRCDYTGVARELDDLLGVRAESAQSLCVRQGRVVSRRTIRSAAQPEKC